MPTLQKPASPEIDVLLQLTLKPQKAASVDRIHRRH